MSNPYVLTITSGGIGLAEVPAAGSPLDLATVDCFCSATTEATLAPTSNTTDIPATFCSPAGTKAVLSSWAVTFNTLQDWGRTDGEESLSEWMFEHDGGTAIFVSYLDLAGTPEIKAIAKVSIMAGSFGGVAGETLASSQTLPVLGTPDIYKSDGTILRHGAGGSTTASISITGDLDCGGGTSPLVAAGASSSFTE